MLTIEEIKEIIPHRYPMLLIDRVEELEAGKSIKAKKNVSVNEPFFQGHFPHEPVMPGVLIVEAMAQAGALYYQWRSSKAKQLILAESIKRNSVRKSFREIL
jgi:beta-hydroxyacyl-ACP dehydratase FabZ